MQLLKKREKNGILVQVVQINMKKDLIIFESSTNDGEGGSWYGDTIVAGGTGMTDFYDI